LPQLGRKEELMVAERIGKETGARGAPLFALHLVERCGAPVEIVYDLLADLQTHAEWGGRRQKSKKYRLTSIEAPPGPAGVGTEFTSTGVGPGGRFIDSSVVTEATQPAVFEFVTEAGQQPRRGEIREWTCVHRYEITPGDAGCQIAYSILVIRLSPAPWWTRSRATKSLIRKISGSFVRGGLRALARMAEERASTRSARI
jgi:hypothetical protein